MDTHIRIKFKGLRNVSSSGTRVQGATYTYIGQPENIAGKLNIDGEYNAFKIQQITDGSEALITLYSDNKERKLGSTRISTQDEWHTFAPSVANGNSIIAELESLSVPEGKDELEIEIVLSYMISDNWKDL